MTRHFTILLFLLILPHFIYGQKKAGTLTDSVYYSDGAITISYVVAKCTDPSKGKNQSNVVVTIDNHSASEQEVSYYLEKQFNNYCLGCTETEQQKIHLYSIPAGQSVSGQCFEVASGLSFVASIDLPGASSQLVSFEFKNIKVIQK